MSTWIAKKVICLQTEGEGGESVVTPPLEGKKAKKTQPTFSSKIKFSQKTHIFHTSPIRCTAKWRSQSLKVETETCFPDFPTLNIKKAVNYHTGDFMKKVLSATCVQ